MSVLVSDYSRLLGLGQADLIPVSRSSHRAWACQAPTRQATDHAAGERWRRWGGCARSRGQPAAHMRAGRHLRARAQGPANVAAAQSCFPAKLARPGTIERPARAPLNLYLCRQGAASLRVLEREKLREEAMGSSHHGAHRLHEGVTSIDAALSSSLRGIPKHEALDEQALGGVPFRA
jgi:hypothetical protein